MIYGCRSSFAQSRELCLSLIFPRRKKAQSSVLCLGETAVVKWGALDTLWMQKWEKCLAGDEVVWIWCHIGSLTDPTDVGEAFLQAETRLQLFGWELLNMVSILKHTPDHGGLHGISEHWPSLWWGLRTCIPWSRLLEMGSWRHVIWRERHCGSVERPEILDLGDCVLTISLWANYFNSLNLNFLTYQ